MAPSCPIVLSFVKPLIRFLRLSFTCVDPSARPPACAGRDAAGRGMGARRRGNPGLRRLDVLLGARTGPRGGPWSAALDRRRSAVLGDHTGLPGWHALRIDPSGPRPAVMLRCRSGAAA